MQNAKQVAPLQTPRSAAARDDRQATAKSTTPADHTGRHGNETDDTERWSGAASEERHVPVGQDRANSSSRENLDSNHNALPAKGGRRLLDFDGLTAAEMRERLRRSKKQDIREKPVPISEKYRAVMDL